MHVLTRKSEEEDTCMLQNTLCAPQVLIKSLSLPPSLCLSVSLCFSVALSLSLSHAIFLFL
jgi:hypothetical protein